ncbi:MAG: hypothetical protein ABFD81_11515 [Syntrophaceae bacterium]
MAKIRIDTRLLDVSMEIHALEEYLKTMEKQVDHIISSEKLILDNAIQNQNITPNEPEWDLAHQNYSHRVEFLLPRFFRGPFLVSLYAVYEASVTEIARLLQKSLGRAISIGDLRGDDFLDRAKKYYWHILNFDLCTDDSAWQQVKILAEVRNAIAHTNGRIDMLREPAKKIILNWEKKRIGIDTQLGYMVFDRAFVEKTFSKVRSCLEDLTQRYKKWDGERKNGG